VSVRILLIEDDPGDRVALERALRWAGEGIELVSVKTEAAAALLSEGSFDCAIIDLRTPEPGFPLVGAGEGTPAVPMIVLVAEFDEKVEAQVLQSGAEDYLIKDEVNGRALVRAVHRAIERHRLRLELEATRARLERLARIDPLTELLNRRGAEEVLLRLSERARIDGTDAIALLIDVDDFKRINDTAGMAAGDETLRDVARVLRLYVRPTDTLARVGGDEFLVILPDTSKVDALGIAHRLSHLLRDATFQTPNGSVQLTASIGAGFIEKGTQSVTRLFEQVERGLRKAKMAGKDRAFWVDAEPADEAEIPDNVTVLHPHPDV